MKAAQAAESVRAGRRETDLRGPEATSAGIAEAPITDGV
jgi:hypothetical protein